MAEHERCTRGDLKEQEVEEPAVSCGIALLDHANSTTRNGIPTPEKMAVQIHSNPKNKYRILRRRYVISGFGS